MGECLPFSESAYCHTVIRYGFNLYSYGGEKAQVRFLPLRYMTKILGLGGSICFRTQPSELSTAPVDGSLGRFSSSQLTWSALFRY